MSNLNAQFLKVLAPWSKEPRLLLYLWITRFNDPENFYSRDNHNCKLSPSSLILLFLFLFLDVYRFFFWHEVAIKLILHFQVPKICVQLKRAVW
jgi:hypothetical protein